MEVSELLWFASALSAADPALCRWETGVHRVQVCQLAFPRNIERLCLTSSS